MTRVMMRLAWPVQRLKELLWFFTNPRERSLGSGVGVLLTILILGWSVFKGATAEMQVANKPAHIFSLYLLGVGIALITDILSAKQDEMWEKGDLEGLTNPGPEVIAWLVERAHWLIIGGVIVLLMS